MRRLVRHAVFVIAAVVTLGWAPDASAQERGRLSVKVVDQTGGALPNAALVLHRSGVRNVQAPPSVVTDARGVYAASDLTVGKYEFTVTAEGFVPARVTATVRVDRATEITVVLLVRHDEDVKVGLLNIARPNSLTGMTFSGESLARLPGGEIDLLARLQELAGTRGRPGDVAIYVDGFRDFRRLPPKAAIDLIQINADPYSTEFPEPGTRRIEIITKPGADGVFGELKSDFNDDSLNAREPLATGKPQLQRRTYSGYFSAPIMRMPTFARRRSIAHSNRRRSNKHSRLLCEPPT
jgi:hypothetical protein